MKKLTNLPFGSREEYFLSDIYSKGKLLAQGIKSKLILNDIKYSRALLLLYIPNENYRRIHPFSEFEIKGYFENVEGEKIGEIHIPKGYRSNSNVFTSSWNEGIMEIVPYEIYRKHYFPGQNEAKKEKQNIFFILTDNKMVKPFENIEISSTGVLKKGNEPTVILNFKDDLIATFEEHDYYIDTKIEEVNGTFSTSHLLLKIEMDNHFLASVDEVKILSELLDKLLWYLSFGSRQRTTWIKWTAEIGNEFVEYYRNNIFIPEKIISYKEPLVDIRTFQGFLQHCLEYDKQQNNLDLYLPVLYLVASDNPRKTMEMEFLSLFIALEALLDLYAESRNKNKHFKKERWEPFKTHIEESINVFSGFNKTEKDLMIEKLGIFNQPSRKKMYNDFCNDMKIDNTDLWPIYGTNTDLSRIRNKLIQGKRFEYETFLSIANEHLRWTVERSLLAVLGWKGIADVDREGLRKYTAYYNWKSYYEKDFNT